MRVIQLDDAGKEEILSKYGSSYEERPSALENILSYVQKELLCKSVLIEEGYVCKDYRSEYSYLYSKVFEQFKSLAIRLHFFSTEVKSEVDLETSDITDADYCGYMVIRPIKIGKVGRTVLKPAKIDQDRFYYICTTQNKSHIGGREFSITGSPFIQQDSMLMCCAHSAIWIATRYMSGPFHYQECLPHEISESASRAFVLGTRVIPTEGLSAYDTFNCFLNLGYSPVLFSRPRRKDFQSDSSFEEAIKLWQPARNIYRYVESGFPVIMLVPNHAVVALGHTLRPDRWSGSPSRHPPFETANVIHSDEWVDGFIVHDDTASPYRLLPTNSEDAAKFKVEGIEHLLPPSKQKYRTIEDVLEYIVPLPEKVYVQSEHIDEILKGIFEGPLALRLYFNTRETAKSGNTMAQEFITSMVDTKRNPIVVRSYIAESTKYKAALRSLRADDIPSLLRESLLALPMSRFVWVIDITNAQNMSLKHNSDRRMFGQVLLDATGNKFALPCLAVHLPGQLYLPAYEKEAWPEPMQIPNDHPQPILERRLMLDI